jgi:serine/threonine protein kinase
MLKGKLAYLAPEQVVHAAVDHRADIFALGIVLYELTTMSRAFRADSDLLTLERITTGTVPLPSLVVRGYPQALEDIVMRCLQIDPAARYQNAGDLALALERFAAANGILLGHGAITGPMKQLFSEARRRFARSSSRIKSLDAPIDISEFTPVTPMDELTPLTPVEPVRALEPADSPMTTTVNPIVPLPIEHDETTQPVDVLVDAPPPPEIRFRAPSPPLGQGSNPRMPLPTPPLAVDVRPIQPSPFGGTALVRRRAPRRMEPYFYIGVGVFLLAVLAAILR